MKYQFCIRFDGIDVNSSATKAVLDCNRIFLKNGYKDYTFTVRDNTEKATYYWSLIKQLLVFFFAVKANSIVGIQYPLLSVNTVFKYFIKAARLKKVRFFCVVHDLESLRTGGKNKELIQQEIARLNEYDVLIVHNQAMLNWLRQLGLTQKMILLELFDYLSDEFKIDQFHTANAPIVYAGNLSKSTFIYSLGGLSTTFNLYGPGMVLDQANSKNIDWKGQYGPEEVPQKLSGSFGLIWDGKEIDKCDEILGNYLKYNNPHKCSLYIAAGLPLIAPRNSAIGNLVRKLNIGILVDNLHDLDHLTYDDLSYQQMKVNVQKIRLKVITGGFFNEALKSIDKLYGNS